MKVCELRQSKLQPMITTKQMSSQLTLPDKLSILLKKHAENHLHQSQSISHRVIQSIIGNSSTVLQKIIKMKFNFRYHISCCPFSPWLALFSARSDSFFYIVHNIRQDIQLSRIISSIIAILLSIKLLMSIFKFKLNFMPL